MVGTSNSSSLLLKDAIESPFQTHTCMFRCRSIYIDLVGIPISDTFDDFSTVDLSQRRLIKVCFLWKRRLGKLHNMVWVRNILHQFVVHLSWYSRTECCFTNYYHILWLGYFLVRKKKEMPKHCVWKVQNFSLVNTFNVEWIMNIFFTWFTIIMFYYL